MKKSGWFVSVGFLSLFALACYAAFDTQFKGFGALWPIMKFTAVMVFGCMVLFHFGEKIADAEVKEAREKQLGSMTEDERSKFLNDELESKKKKRREQDSNLKRQINDAYVAKYRYSNKKIKCKFCEKTGDVRWGNITEFSESTKTNVTVLGVKTIIGTTTNGQATKVKGFWCQGCDMEWIE